MMRTLVFFICLLFIFSCNTETKPQKPEFLLGKWIRTNDKPGSTTYENWQNNFTGLGYTLKEKDTVFKEILSIVSINDTLTLKVEGVNETPTLFQLTSQTDTSFIAENPTHDFPTKINYWLENKQLKAHVSNKEFGIEFVFEKQNSIASDLLYGIWGFNKDEDAEFSITKDKFYLVDENENSNYSINKNKIILEGSEYFREGEIKKLTKDSLIVYWVEIDIEVKYIRINK